MSRNDAQRPAHATGEEYADALSGLIEKKPGRKKKRGGRGSSGQEPGRKETNPFHVFLLVAALSGLVGWNVYYLTLPAPPAAPAQQRRSASVRLYHAAQAVERYRARTGSLPAELASLNIPQGDFEYVRADTGYTIVLRTEDTFNQYRSGDDVRELLARAGIAGKNRSGAEAGADPPSDTTGTAGGG